MTYTFVDYPTKKALIAAVTNGDLVTVYEPGIGTTPMNGQCCVEGPHYPKPHRWYATVTVKDGAVVKVK